MLYMSSATGAPLYAHYCMDKMVSFSFQKNENEKCPKCGMKDTSGCCKDEQKMLKFSDDHKQTITAVFSFLTSREVLENSFHNLYFSGTIISQDFPVAHAPPHLSAIPLFIQHCVLLI